MDYNLIEVSNGQCWSLKERRFVENAINEKEIGHITPKAFSPFNATKEPDPKYFREILEKSLTETETEVFCEDFLRLLNHNQKRNKEKVPCLTGDANSGKPSLFQPLLGLINHDNIATITKQKVFNKAMINHTTEAIFIDEASPSTLDIDDWKTRKRRKPCDRCLSDILTDPQEEMGKIATMLEDSSEDERNTNDDQCTSNLRRALEKSSPGCLRHRQIASMLQT